MKDPIQAREQGVAWSLLGNLALLVLLVAAAALLLPLHDEAWWQSPPRPLRWWLLLAALVAYAGLCLTFLRRAGGHSASRALAASQGGPPVLVAWASQTGFAQLLAERSATMLREGGVPVLTLPLDEVDAALLARTGRALFIASTTGEGDPPDHAIGFLRRVMPQAPALPGLEYALLALGDREYHDFCAFGRQLDEWLRGHDARPLFDRVEVDNADQATLRHWQYEVGRIGGFDALPDWTPPAYEPWRLLSRAQVNDGSPGAPVFDLALVPAAGPLPDWEAGDIAEVGARNSPARVRALLDELGLEDATMIDGGDGKEPLAERLTRMQLPPAGTVAGLSAQQLADALDPLPHREYSIASVPAEGEVRLLVRRMTRPDGSAGMASGWLCDTVLPGQSIDVRLRRNAGFHPPPADLPLVLIGNGTGIAGLRAHIQARIHAGARDNWLLFGERSPDHDRFYGDDIHQWQAAGWLARIDLAFSRAPDAPAYVQHRLQAAADTLREWVDRGASILVCGNATGMAPAVDDVLADVLGEESRDALRAAGRYRRDVY
ncbi:sulfite reductase flavoprotein subunit alpha [Pseudoxanthomonas daejeonensis]|uniref:flavodoxin domain-containing protein n=1 Tax=Pseudoxanthomonas daejeonensis TaxID=266062 RepID=UPI001F544A69|nr:sulfite reductase flavoprotein subunit alpha [Pseudoxanthomonas daejeonensis]UNK56900.1 sulfite reductase flavoprotein subunit alpha [Pseudoxanthomonas daejeonensis]